MTTRWMAGVLVGCIGWLASPLLASPLVQTPGLSGTWLEGAENRPSPPWQTTCQAMEQETLGHLFFGAECRTRFEEIFASSDVATTHAWMVENRSCFKEWSHFAWIAYAANEPKMADLAWLHQLYMAQQRTTAVDGCEDRACITTELAALLERGEEQTIGGDARAHTSAFLDEVERNQSFADQMDKALAGVTPLCLLHFNLECSGAMTKALNWMYPRSYRLSRDPPESMTFSMLTATREVFLDTATQRYASRLALALLQAIEAGDLGISRESFYEMAVRYFESDYDRLWNFLAVYATRGAAWTTAYKMVHEDNQPLFGAMMVISSAMGVLDTHLAEVGSAWSYARSGNDTCFQPKPYHYWMAGSFAYLLRKEGYSARTSKQVARLLGALYEVGSTTMGRDPDEVFFVPAFDPKVNRARREVVHHALGSAAGIAYRDPPVQDFDATLERLMRASKPLPAYDEDEMRRRIADNLSRWRLWTDLTAFYETFAD